MHRSAKAPHNHNQPRVLMQVRILEALLRMNTREERAAALPDAFTPFSNSHDAQEVRTNSHVMSDAHAACFYAGHLRGSFFR